MKIDCEYVEIMYEWSRDRVVLKSYERVQYLLDRKNYTKGQVGMHCTDSGIYKLNISNIAGSTVTYLANTECSVYK